MTSTAHKHRPLKGAALVNAARKVLVADGEQWTDMREKVFEVLADAGQPASAYDIAARLATLLSRRIAPNSVYRILDLFVARNLAVRVESRNAYIVNDHPGCAHDCIFLICKNCGQTVHIDDDEISRTVRHAASIGGFVPDRPLIEVVGLCQRCT